MVGNRIVLMVMKLTFLIMTHKGQWSRPPRVCDVTTHHFPTSLLLTVHHQPSCCSSYSLHFPRRDSLLHGFFLLTKKVIVQESLLQRGFPFYLINLTQPLPVTLCPITLLYFISSMTYLCLCFMFINSLFYQNEDRASHYFPIPTVSKIVPGTQYMHKKSMLNK